MTTFVWSNFFSTTLSAAVASGDTTINVASATDAPTITTGQQWAIIVQSASTPSSREVMYVTAISSDAFTVTRGQEGTAAGTWAVGDYVIGGNTEGVMAALGQLAATQTWSGANTFSNPVTVAAATTAAEAVNGNNFPSSLGANGWKKYPDPNSPTGYFIEQWGEGTYPFQLTTTGQNFPIAFPNGVFHFVCSFGSSINLTAYTTVGGQPSSLSQFEISVSSASTGSDGVYWRAKGY